MKIVKTDTKNLKNVRNTYQEIEDFVFSKFKIRQNIITNQLEIIKDKEYLNIYDLIRECRLQGLKVSKTILSEMLKSSKVERYNPYKEFFNFKVEKYNFEIEKLFKYIHFKQLESNINFQTYFKKWLVNAVGQILEEGFSNDVMLLLVSEYKQGIGKTTLIRKLIEPIGYIKTGQSLLKRIENLPEASTLYPFIFYDDMLGLSSQRELDIFKTTITDTIIEYRKFQKIYRKKRIANFVGTADNSNLLFDYSGSRRFLIIEVEKINFAGYNNNINFINIWKDAFYLYKTDFNSYKWTQEDFTLFNDYNQKFYKPLNIQFWIEKYFEPTSESDINAIKMTASQILKHLLEKDLPSNVYNEINPIKLGITLKKLGFYSKRIKTGKNSDKYYFVKLK